MKEILPKRIDKPWGYEILFALTPAYAGKLIFVKKGERLSLQHHEKKDETLFIHSGKTILEIEDGNGVMKQITLESGMCRHVPPLTKHRLKAIEDVVIFEASTPELNDIKRFADDYGRA